MELAKLGELFKITSGGTPSKTNLEFYEDGKIPWIKTGDLKVKNIYNSSDYITELAVEKSSAKLFPKDTVLIAMYGATIGATSILKIEATTNQACCAFLPSDKMLPEYLYYFFRANKENIVSMGVGGAQPNISATILKNIKIPVLELKQQTKVIEILDKAQKLIDKRKVQIEALDESVKSQFIEMFGDVKSNPFKWEVNRLEEIYDIIDGDRGKNYPKQDEFFDSEHCLFLNAGNVTSKGFCFEKNAFITKKKDEMLRKGKIQRDDLVVTTRGTVGNIAYYNEKVPFQNIRINSGMVILRKRKEINPLYFINYFGNKSIYQSLISGTAQPQMPISNMKNAKIYYPPMELQNQFADFVNQVDKLKFEMQESLTQLEDNFNSLIHRAFRGELFN